MKVFILILSIMTIENSFANYWVNEHLKTVYYVDYPEVELSLIEVGASKEAWAYLDIKSKFTNNEDDQMLKEIKQLYPDHKIRKVIVDVENTGQVKILKDSYTTSLLNSPSGAALETSIFLTKKKFHLLKKRLKNEELNELVKFDFSAIANVPVSNVLETKSLDALTCHNLFRRGSKLFFVFKEYIALKKRIENEVTYTSVGESLINQVKQKCFKGILSERFTTFDELLSLNLQKRNLRGPIKAEKVEQEMTIQNVKYNFNVISSEVSYE